MLEILQTFWYVVVVVIQLIGIIAALDAIWKGRTAQGSIAWAVSLILVPYLALPLYWLFGDRKFYAYVRAMRSGNKMIKKMTENVLMNYQNQKLVWQDNDHHNLVMQKLASLPFTVGNEVALLIDGQKTFEAIFAAIEKAEEYILIQFYSIHEDELGNRLRNLLLKKARENVDIYFLYDQIGSRSLSAGYICQLHNAGIFVSDFRSHKGWSLKLRLNFRNHRKIVVIDGRTAFVGGCNVSKKYLGTDRKFGYWRDTQIKITGPAVQAVQLPFVSDWYWSTSLLPDLKWSPEKSEIADVKILSLSSGPADELETCGLFFVNAINSAQKRLWLVSPYFVPDQQVLSALQLAALRGVDVRLIIPQKSDLLITYLSSFSFLEEIIPTGVKVYRYDKGYLHEKVMLIDDDRAMIGTSNLDNRSFRINFEINLLMIDRDFAGKVENMLKEDLSHSRQIGLEDYGEKPFWFKLAVKISRLMAPLQ
jgi:Phosphatidylserine/phosphatidylglycerophosphate/cardiolipin synthases and related enzymes